MIGRNCTLQSFVQYRQQRHPKFRPACLNGKLGTIIALVIESRREAHTKLSPDILSIMVAEVAWNNHLDVVSTAYQTVVSLYAWLEKELQKLSGPYLMLAGAIF